MITMKNTPQFAGVTFSGTTQDMEELYDALHHIVGYQELDKGLEPLRLSILGFCYELRHARMGNRSISSEEHGLDPEILKWHSMILPAKNVIVEFNVLWPYLIQVVYALNEFIDRYLKQHKKKISDWDLHVASVRLFQSKVLQLAETILSERAFSNFKKMIQQTPYQPFRYYPQFIDYLCHEWEKLSREMRAKKLQIFGKRLFEYSTEYEKFVKDIDGFAAENDILPSEVNFVEDDEPIEW